MDWRSLIILDTHVLLWALAKDARLGEKSRGAIDESAKSGGLGISAITPWEIAMLVEKGRLSLGRDVQAWMDEALGTPGIRLIPIEPCIAIDSIRLPGSFHSDPSDRLIVATARHVDAPLMTADRAILNYGAAGYVVVMNAGI